MSQTTGRTVHWPMVPYNESLSELRVNQLPRDVWGSSGPLLGALQSWSLNGDVLCINRGAREARLSRVVAQRGHLRIGRSNLPTRQSSGGVLVVVGGRESRPHGEGVQDDLCLDD